MREIVYVLYISNRKRHGNISYENMQDALEDALYWLIKSCGSNYLDDSTIPVCFIDEKITKPQGEITYLSKTVIKSMLKAGYIAEVTNEHDETTRIQIIVSSFVQFSFDDED